MTYLGDESWHMVVETLPARRPIEVWKQATRLDWTIQIVPVQHEFEGRGRVMPERFALTRNDTGSALLFASEDYRVVQPAEVLELYQDRVAQRHYTWETASELGGGRKVWALAKSGIGIWSRLSVDPLVYVVFRPDSWQSRVCFMTNAYPSIHARCG